MKPVILPLFSSSFWKLAVLVLCAWGGRSVVAAPSMPPAWTYATGDAILSSPALGPGHTVYFGSYDQYLYALNATNGQLRWRYSVKPARNNEYAYIFSSPAVAADGTIYFGTDHQLGGNGGSAGELYALNPNGTLKWVYPVGAAIYSDPAIGADGTIYFGCYDTNLYALNPNGTLKWKSLAGDQIYSDPIVGPDGAIYFGCDNGRLYAVNTNGTARWNFNTGRVITGSPAMGTGGVLYVGSLSSNLFAISPAGGTNWVFNATNRIESSPAIGPDGTIYIGCNNGRLFAVNPNGTLKWSALIASSVQSSPAVAQDGTIYVGTDDGDLRALDPNGNTLWSTFTASYVYSSPVIGPDGMVYVGSVDTNFYAFAGTSGPAASPWPMFRHDAQHTARFLQPAVTNTPPTLSNPGNRTVHAGASAVVVPFIIGDAETPATNLTLSVVSSNPVVVPQAGLMLGGSASNRTVNVTPAAGQLGAATITLTLTDAGAVPLSAATSFTFTVVKAPMIQPSITDGTNVLLSWNSIAGTSYQLQRKTFLDDPMWVDLPGAVTATNGTASILDSTDNSPQRFYRLLVLP